MKKHFDELYRCTLSEIAENNLGLPATNQPDHELSCRRDPKVLTSLAPDREKCKDLTFV